MPGTKVLISKYLPYHIDFSTLADGGLPSPWAGATWSVAGGVALNTPTLGGELLSDPGLEANYTASLCDTFTTKQGAPTVSQSADVHGGAKAQAFQAVGGADGVYFQYDGTAEAWYRYSIWAKRLSGTQGRTVAQLQTNLLHTSQVAYLNGAAYAQVYVSERVPTTDNRMYLWGARAQSTTPWDSLVIDDMSLKQITASTLFAVKQFGKSDVLIQVTVTALDGFDPSYVLPTGKLGGLAMNVDSTINPLYGVIAYVDGSSIYLDKLVNGVYTNLVKVTMKWVESKLLKLEKSGTTYRLYYDGVQQGADQTISDVGIVGNTYHGLFSTGGVSFGAFYCLPANMAVTVAAYAGTSITYGSSIRPFAAQNRTHLQTTRLTENLTASLAAQSGVNTWNNLKRLRTEVTDLNPILVTLDTQNDGTAFHKACEEAWIRVIRTLHPTAKIVWLDKANQSWVQGLADHYLVSVCDWYAWALAEIAAGRETWATLLSDGTHFTAHGDDTAEALLAPIVDAQLADPDPQWSGALPARLYDNGDYENEPVVVPGTGYDARTGIWTDVGMQISSSDIGATVTYSGTFKSIGCYRADGGANSVQISVDGGAFTVMAFNSSGVEIGARAAHTIVIKVAAGTVTIDEFWAI